MCKITSYVDSSIRPELYREGFDPMQLLRLMRNDDGSLKWSLDYDVKRYWFRLIHPDGRILFRLLQSTSDYAVVNARVYASRSDGEQDYLAEATAMRSGSTDPNCKYFERYFLDSAETAAASRALSNAGFDLIGCNITVGGRLLNPVTGEPVTESQAGMLAGQDEPDPAQNEAQAANPPVAEGPAKATIGVGSIRNYSDKTAPPEQAAEPQKPEQQTAASQETQLTLEEAKAYVIPMGTFKGMSVGDLALRNPGGLGWYLTGYKGPDDKLRAAVKLLLDMAGEKKAG